jgi:glycine oxidase
MASAPRPDVLVLGGGIVGLACARELARRGFAVELVERDRPGAGASSAAAGLLAVLAEPPEDGPLFAAQREARDEWPAWLAEVEAESGAKVERDDSGALLLSLSEADEAHLTAIEAAARRHGEPIEEVPLDRLRAWVPDVSPAARRCLRLPGELRFDNPACCAALAEAAARAGAAIRTGVEVSAVELRADSVRVLGREGFAREAGLLVLAAGAWSARLPGLPPLPVKPMRGQVLRLEGVAWPWRGSVRGAAEYVVRRGAASLLVGSTVEDAGYAPWPTPEGLHRLLGFALDAFPGLAGPPVGASWAGLRPGTEDGLPLVGRLPGLPVLAATGHFRNGLLLAPWTARRIADLAAGAADDHPFSPARLAPAPV